jgi:hypothetical protein
MRTIAALTAWLLMNAAFSFSWNDPSGIVRSIDISTRQVVLDDGNTYSVRRGINLAKFRAGDKVTLHTEDDNGREIVTKVTKGEFVPARPKLSGRSHGVP